MTTTLMTASLHPACYTNKALHCNRVITLLVTTLFRL